MKRLLALIIALSMAIVMIFGLSSCNTSSNNGGDNCIADGNNQGNNDFVNTDDENDENGGNIESDGNIESGGNIESDGNTDGDSCNHVDANGNDYCDLCNDYLIVVIDFYVFNDLHGKFCDTATQPGVDEIGTYLENREKIDDNIVILSSGDMWQGSAESNLTYGKIMTEWMNGLGFVSMTLGNHEFDWGEGRIRENYAIAEFPFLAINVYNKSTNTLADYCAPSVMVERDGLKIGIIGAIGDCYSSISSDMVGNVTFKVGSALTTLVKNEATKLRNEGADLIVYSLHDGYSEDTTSGYYDEILSGGYVDIVFESHTHQQYVQIDGMGVYHLQAGGENYGLSHIEIAVNSANGNNKVTTAEIVRNQAYYNLADHEFTESLEDKYADVIEYAYTTIGTVNKSYSDSEIEDYVASLYLEAGIEKWGSKYNIFLGGGFLRTRTPYNLSSGSKTYADILSLVPFDNRLCLCSVKGSKLNSVFINTTNDDYHIALSDYGKGTTVSSYSTYYVIVDTYTALYSYNGLTIIEYYDDTTFARDLLADAIREGRLGTGVGAGGSGSGSGNNSGSGSGNESGGSNNNEYTITPISSALQVGNGLADGAQTTEYLYYKGTITKIDNTTYGNFYIKDEYGNSIYVYGLKDSSGNRYDKMTTKPGVGDEIIISSLVKKYVYQNSGDIVIELVNSKLVAINP